MKKFTSIIATAAIFVVPMLNADLAFARRGADDPAGHIRGEGAGHASLLLKHDLMQIANKGSDHSKGHDSDDDNGGSSRSKPRTPGGSGCDSARDKIEHPECRV
jgi:hypothetical protein